MATILLGDTLSLVACAVFFLVVQNVVVLCTVVWYPFSKDSAANHHCFEYRIIPFNFGIIGQALI